MIVDRDEDRCDTILNLKINVTTSFNQMVSDGHMSMTSSVVKRCVPIVLMSINVTENVNQLLRDGLMS